MKQAGRTTSLPPRGALRREIAALLCVKLAALALIYWAFFGPSTQPHLTTPDLAAHLLVSGGAHGR